MKTMILMASIKSDHKLLSLETEEEIKSIFLIIARVIFFLFFD